MITKVEIKNFQSHKNATLDFVPGTNVIIGASDAGKSAIFRAINWVASNRPLGDAFRSEWGGDTTVVVHTSEGDIIERTRSSSKNEYKINGRALTAFGSEVPEEVLRVLHMDSTNIQAQMDPPFLIASTPGEAARLLNKAASIDDIDHTISGLRKSYNKVDESVKHTQKQLLEYHQEMEQYFYLPTLEQRLEKAEELEKERAEKETRASQLKSLARGAREIETQLESTAQIPDLIDQCAEIEKQHDAYQNKRKEQRALSNLTTRAEELTEFIVETEDVEQGIVAIKEAEQLHAQWKEKSQALNTYKRLLSRATQLTHAVEDVEQTIAELEYDFHALAPERCPLCGNKME